MDMIQTRVRREAPLVHCMTNYVTANDCANLLLAVGASPIMADSPDEAEDVVSLCGALVINTGTLSRDRLKAMLLAGKKANKLDIPVLLDPAGAGSSSARTEAVKTLTEQVKFSVIRANFSEISVIAGEGSPKRGVDADGETRATDEVKEKMKTLAANYDTVILATGQTDIVADGKTASEVVGGSPLMRKITGAGCMLSALTGAYLAVWRGENEDAFGAAHFAAGDMKMCAQAAEKRMSGLDGNASFRTYLIDSFYTISKGTERLAAFENMWRNASALRGD